MALPSSPPLPAQADYPSSPILAAEESADLLPIRPGLAPVAGGSRKRQYSDYGSLSSDPWFSEGTSDPEYDEAEAAQQPRRKRMVRGPWWRVSGLRRGMAKRERLRNADSGVWLGSDASEESVDSTMSSRRKLARLDVRDGAAPASASAVQSARHMSRAEALAARTINACLDAGREAVDLSNLGLSGLSDNTLRPLHQLIRHTHTSLTQPPSEDEFGPLTPSLQLYLAGNKLSALPTELFTLTNITVLSLRNNELTRLPPSIGRLTKLKELNIAQNGIQHLPWELFSLFDCDGGVHRQITTRPNPLIDPIPRLRGPSPLPRPRHTSSEFKEHLSRWGETNGAFFAKMKHWYSEDDVAWTMRHELELHLKLGRLKRTNYLQEASRAGVEIQLCKEQLIYLTSSAVRFFGVDGSPLRDGAAGSMAEEKADGHHRYRAVADPLANAPDATTHSTIPSLFELALRSLQRNFNLGDDRDATDHSSAPNAFSEFPTSVSTALHRAAMGADVGNEACSVCGKHFLIARAEWMEFWFNGFPAQEWLTQETVLPFCRRACSWACARPSGLGEFRV